MNLGNAYFWEMTPARVEALKDMIDEDAGEDDVCACPDCVTLRQMLDEAKSFGVA